MFYTWRICTLFVITALSQYNCLFYIFDGYYTVEISFMFKGYFKLLRQRIFIYKVSRVLIGTRSIIIFVLFHRDFGRIGLFWFSTLRDNKGVERCNYNKTDGSALLCVKLHFMVQEVQSRFKNMFTNKIYTIMVFIQCLLATKDIATCECMCECVTMKRRCAHAQDGARVGRPREWGNRNKRREQEASRASFRETVRVVRSRESLSALIRN